MLPATIVTISKAVALVIFSLIHLLWKSYSDVRTVALLSYLAITLVGVLFVVVGERTKNPFSYGSYLLLSGVFTSVSALVLVVTVLGGIAPFYQEGKALELIYDRFYIQIIQVLIEAGNYYFVYKAWMESRLTFQIRHSIPSTDP